MQVHRDACTGSGQSGVTACHSSPDDSDALLCASIDVHGVSVAAAAVQSRMQTADFRSDTVTRPDAAMRQAMLDAPVGDDVYFEDPTVTELQAELAAMTGFEAGLFTPSGTMANQIALAVHCRPGQEVIMPEGAHVYEYEPGAMAVIGGLLPRLVPARLGVPETAAVEAAIQDSIHKAETGLISLENTHNAAGGTVVPLSRTREITDLAHRQGLPAHLDAARGFNAAAALGVSIAEVCVGFDSVSICLSKGLGAPVGSVLLGSGGFIRKAHRLRKMLGGGMRQAGILAAAGLVAIREGPARLLRDHEQARRLAEGLAVLPGLTVDLAAVQTNMVYVSVPAADKVAAELAGHGVLCNALDGKLRFVTHHQLADGAVDRAVEAVRSVLGARHG